MVESENLSQVSHLCFWLIPSRALETLRHQCWSTNEEETNPLTLTYTFSFPLYLGTQVV